MEISKKKQATLKDSNYFQPNTYLGKFKEEFTGRGIANILATTILAPLERWRIIAQTQQTYPSNPKKFNSFFDFIAKSPKQQGTSSLWRGNYSSIWIYIYQTIFQIGVYDSIKEMAKDIQPELGDSQILKFISNDIFFPFYSSLITTTIIHPVDTYRIQRTMSYHQNQADALVAKFRWRRSQIGRGLYHGFWMANIIGLIQFNLYKNLSSLVEGHASGNSILEVMTPNTILSILAVGLVHPLDTLKKIYQLNNQHKPQLFKSYRDVLKYLQENKSVSILYNGFVASVTKTAIMTPLYILILNGLNQYKGQTE